MTAPTSAPHTLAPCLPSLQASQRQPLLFVGHGSPVNVIERNAWNLTWRDVGADLLQRYGRPQLILCVSAHWLTRGHWRVTGAAQPPTVHDFSGFAPELYQVQYPAPGAPQVAHELAACLQAPRPQKTPALLVDDERGLDHGAWGVLQPMFPQADIPVLQLSMDYTASMQEHWALGQQLAALRDQGVLIVASGNIVHNLPLRRPGTGVNATYRWALEFDDRVSDLILSGQQAQLTQFEHWGDITELCHPSAEHFWPMLYAAAAVQPGDTPQFFNAGFQMASICMRSVLWQAPSAASVL